jgi:steroid Delta-isomerase
MADVADRVEEHFRLFNQAVRSQDWAAFLATFTPDAVMRFEGVPAGPYAGLDQIARAYAEQPPSDTMSCASDERDGDADVVRFAWDAGGGGTMRITWRDGAVAGLTVTFDALWCLPRARDHRENRHDVG